MWVRGLEIVYLEEKFIQQKQQKALKLSLTYTMKIIAK